MVFNPI